VIVAFAWLHGGAANPFNPIAEAAERTDSAAGARLTFEAIYSSPASTRRIVMSGHGVYNGRTGRSRATMNVPESLQPIEMEAVGDRRSVFLRSSLISNGLPPGKEWMGIEPLLGQSDETALGGSSNPKSQLEMLRSVGGNVETVGQQNVQGLPTTQYRGSFDLQDFADFLDREGKKEAAQEYEQLAKEMPSEIGVEAWIDPNGLVRQSKMVLTLPTGAGQPAITMDMRFDFFDFGITPAVRVPSPNKVFDATPLARARLHLLNGSSALPPLPPKSSEALSSAAFKDRANAICANANHESKLLLRRTKPQRSAFVRVAHEVRGGTATLAEATEAARTYAYDLYEPAIRGGRRVLREFAQLVPPPSQRTYYRELMRTGAQQDEVYLAESLALETGSYRILRELAQLRHSLTRRSNQSAISLGLDACVEKK